jgi:ferredoxin
MGGETILTPNLGPLIAALRAQGRRVIGPTVRDDAIVLDELTGDGDLPHGWGVETEAGRYRLHRREDRAAFAHSAGPQSWKRFLHPPEDRLWSAVRTADGFTVSDDEPAVAPLAFLGVRSCDLRALGILDTVLGGGRRYAARRADVFVVAVHCTEPGAACFCVSAGGGPRCGTGYDVALTELAGGEYLAGAGSDAGAALLRELPGRPADPATVAAAGRAVDGAADRMRASPRALPDGDLRAGLAAAAGSPHWEEVASRCLSCGNCTMVCPTCFCTDVTDTTDLAGEHAQRWERWASCFDIDFSYLHGGPVRASGASRYRQWLTHKLSTWHDQFGSSGCVGCGRCVVWCPVGIDITVEAAALVGPDTAGRQP